MSNNEFFPELQGEYEQSAHRLFELMGSYGENGEEQTGGLYFSVEWDEEIPYKINNVTTMTVEPTGARRQQLWGQFHSAQFVFTESSGSRTEERFVWCRTGPNSPEFPISLNPLELELDYGYSPLTANNVLATLVERAATTDHLLSLIKLIRLYDIDAVPALTEKVGRHVNVLLQHCTRPQKTEIDDKVLELLVQGRSIGADISKNAQGNIIGSLMRNIVPGGPGSDRAAEIVEAIIAQGLFPNEPRILNRIFGSSEIYKYPFATVWVHSFLERHPKYSSPRYIFGQKRITFAVGYMASILGGNDEQFRQGVYSLANKSLNLDEPEERPVHLYHFVNRLLDYVNLRMDPDVSHPVISNLGEVELAFTYLLSVMKHNGSKVNEDEALFDAKCTEIIRKVLAPVIEQQIGKSALDV